MCCMGGADIDQTESTMDTCLNECPNTEENKTPSLKKLREDPKHSKKVKTST